MTDPRVAPLKRTLELNTRLFLNALDGLSDAELGERPGGTANHIAFLACHLIDTRHYLARELGLDSVCPFKDILANAKSIEDIATFPTLSAILEAWNQVALELSSCLDRLEPEALETPVSASFPIEGGDKLAGALSFLVQHDTYHLGQIALIRRLVGHPAMSYR